MAKTTGQTPVGLMGVPGGAFGPPISGPTRGTFAKAPWGLPVRRIGLRRIPGMSSKPPAPAGTFGLLGEAWPAILRQCRGLQKRARRAGRAGSARLVLGGGRRGVEGPGPARQAGARGPAGGGDER